MYLLGWRTTLDWSVHDHMKSSTITARGSSFLFPVMIQSQFLQTEDLGLIYPAIQSQFLHTEDFRALSIQQFFRTLPDSC